jgi:hypothetical protein
VDRRNLGSGCTHGQRVRMFIGESAGHVEGLEMASRNSTGKEEHRSDRSSFAGEHQDNRESSAPSPYSTRFAKPTRPNAVLVSNQGSLPTTRSAKDSGVREPECDE